MICPNCQNECLPEFDFCPRCATALVLTCPRCGFRVPAGFAFCPKCATALTAQAAASERDTQGVLPQAIQRLIPKEYAERLRATRGQVSTERRQVTMLFCDVKGSTAMGEELDPEDVMEIMNGAFEFLIPPIYRHEGTLARLMGDAILAFFGAPIAHEDDPERAIRAALEITAEATEYAEKLEKERGIKAFNVRVGINTGLVVVGEVGADLRAEYTAMGDAINLAARMEQSAPPGGILITHDTYRHVRGVFDVQAQEPLWVKGKADPVLTYLVAGAKPRTFRKGTRGVEGIETRMIGRDAELHRLQESFYTAAEDRELQFVTITGEAGVGKSRLMYEFDVWSEALPDYTYFFKARASQQMQNLPYAVIRDLFAFRFRIQDSDPLAAVRQKLEGGFSQVLGEGKSQSTEMRAHFVGHLVGFAFGESPHLAGVLEDAKQVHDRALVYLAEYLRAMASELPVVVLLEDLHWADDSSLDTINSLALTLAQQPLMIVCAARPGLFERRPHWGEGQPFHTRLDLRLLSKRDSRRLVEEILQKADQVPEALRDMVVSNAEGNPFYVEELIKMLIEDGVIVKGEERWHVDASRLAAVRVPSTLAGILQARLDSLPTEERTALQRAAVVGRTFWDDAVWALSRPEGGTAVDITPSTPAVLGALRGREMIFERETSAFAGTAEYTFKHTLLRDIAYETVLKRERRTYHARVAEWLIAHSGERAEEAAGWIAEHLELAGQAEQAVAYLQQAGEQALRVGALREARGFFERALASLSLDNLARIPLTIQAGEALFLLGEFAAARQRLEEGLQLAQANADAASRAAALDVLGRMATDQGDYAEATTRLEQSVAVARQVGDRGRVAHALFFLGWVQACVGAFPEARARYVEGQALYQDLGDRRGLARAANSLGTLANLLGEWDEARARLLESLALYRELGDRQGMAVALNNLGEAARGQQNYARASSYYQESLNLSREVGDQVGILMAYANLGHSAVTQGDPAAALPHYCQGMRIARDIGALPGALDILAGVAGALAQTGRPERAAELLGLARHHPALKSDTEPLIEPVLARLRSQLAPDVLEAALARGAELDLGQVVGEILRDEQRGIREA